MASNPSVCTADVWTYNTTQFNTVDDNSVDDNSPSGFVCACGEDRYSNTWPRKKLQGGSIGRCLCPAGQYFKPGIGCFECERGFYSTEAGSVVCKQCGTHYTYSVGANSSEDCVRDPADLAREWIIIISCSSALLLAAGLGVGCWVYRLKHRAYEAESSLKAALERKVAYQDEEIVFLRDWRCSQQHSAPCA